LSRPPSALFLFADFLRAGFAIWTPRDVGRLRGSVRLPPLIRRGS
jgi:hypothetical protein